MRNGLKAASSTHFFTKESADTSNKRSQENEDTPNNYAYEPAALTGVVKKGYRTNVQ
jgi:hypothetical protein